MNCGNIKCAYKCVQMDERVEKVKSDRIALITYAIRDFAKEGINKEVQYKALLILEKVLKHEEVI